MCVYTQCVCGVCDCMDISMCECNNTHTLKTAQSQMSVLTTLFETGPVALGCVHQASSFPRIFHSFSVICFLELQMLLLHI